MAIAVNAAGDWLIYNSVRLSMVLASGDMIYTFLSIWIGQSAYPLRIFNCVV